MTSRTDDPALPFDFFNEIGIISQLSSTMFKKCLPSGVHVAHFAILNHMVRLGDGRTPHQLAAALQVTKATMTHSLGVLSARGFVRIVPHPTDGRSKRVYLTANGRAFREEAIAAVVNVFAHILHTEDLRTIDTVLPGLRSIRKLLDANRELAQAAASDSA
ncbi:MarR family winged helix-turn-helix transcriptional regulator [Oricola cellulosilytica]|uniref:MarR family winged helix-turn-helix transcriptional regulator n=1 Tax=Oricola cellulosilytica TaxID=1429082 RepID=UPI001CBFA685|nr:MarR family transcriptional regulator [Oricola cellulosilytica]